MREESKTGGRRRGADDRGHHREDRDRWHRCSDISRGVAASRFLGRQDLVAYKGLVLTLGSMITIPMVWSM